MAGTGGITDGVVEGARRAALDDLAAQAHSLARAASALEHAVRSMPVLPPTWQGGAARAFEARRADLARRLLLADGQADDARAATHAARSALAG